MGRRPKVSREEVLAAARQVFADRGYDGTTLSAIAARLAVSPAALLRHAATKDELFAAAMEPVPSEMRVPLEFLAELDPHEDPGAVLRRIGEVFVPFIEARFEEQISRWMRAKSTEEARFSLPFDLKVKPTPPQRALALIEQYLRRATEAGRLRVSDPRAAGLMLLSSLQSYVMLHHIVKIADPPLPLDRYLDALVEIWIRGAGPEPAPPEEGKS